MRSLSVLIPVCCAILAASVITGCQSPWVQAAVVNQQDAPIHLVEVDYPGGSFGVQTIAPHAVFHYRFHILATDRITLNFTDAAGHNHTAKGPQLSQKEEGALRIEVAPDNQVVWTPTLTAY